MNGSVRNWLLLAATVALAVFALSFGRPGSGELFAGTDGKAEAVVRELRPDYRPWFAPWWEPPSAEIESLLFGLQSAVGSGILCYALGYWRGSRRNEDGPGA